VLDETAYEEASGVTEDEDGAGEEAPYGAGVELEATYSDFELEGAGEEAPYGAVEELEGVSTG
jgi:hypothetical protein